MNYQDNLHKIFEGKLPGSLRTIFDNGSEEWHRLTTFKKVRYLERLLTSGHSLDFWLQAYSEQYRKTHKHILSAIHPSLSFLLAHTELEEVRTQIESWLEQPSNKTKSRLQLIVDELVEVIEDEPYFKKLQGFKRSRFSSGQHLGAIVVDVLFSNAASNETDGWERAERFAEKYPFANTTSSFLELIISNDVEKILKWQGTEITKVIALAGFLKAKDIETFRDLKFWLGNVNNRNEITIVDAINVGTIDHLKIICGEVITTVLSPPVLKFLKTHVGLPTNRSESANASYEKIVVDALADHFDVTSSALQHVIQGFVSLQYNQASPPKGEKQN